MGQRRALTPCLLKISLEIFSALATTALKLMKMKNTGYAMDIKIGASLLKKVDTTSSSYFNRNIHNELSKVKKM